MTNDKELVEVWRAEFESTIDKPHLLHRFPSGNYSWDSTSWMWAGFQRAKRLQSSVALPKDDGTISQNAYQLDVIAQLTAAGIKYTIGE